MTEAAEGWGDGLPFRDAEVLSILAAARAEAASEIPRRQMALRACLQKIDGRTRRVLILRYVQERSAAEIATRMKTSGDGIRRQLFRIRAALATCIEAGLGNTGIAPAADAASADTPAALSDRYLDGGLPPEDEKRLAAWLREDAAHARAFVRLAILHDQLRATLREEVSGGVPLEAAAAGRGARGGRLRRVALVAGMLIPASIAALLLARRNAGLAVPPAMLAAATDACWSDPGADRILRGGGLPPGRIRLPSGVAEFRLGAGASAAVLGPAEFEIPGPRRFVLRRGRLLVRNRSKDARVVVETPGVTLAGLEADLAVAAGPGLHVFAASLRGAIVATVDDEPTFVDAGGAVRVGDDRRPIPVPPRLDDFAPLLALPPADVDPAVNRLLDPGFEYGLDPDGEAPRPGGPAWRGTPGHVDLAAGAGVNGSAAARVRARGSNAWPQIAQAIGIGPLHGRTVIASIRALQPADDPLRGVQCAVLRVVFRDAAGGEIGGAERRFLWEDDPVGRFLPARLAARAPEKATAIHVQAMLNAGGLGTGTVLFDDARLAWPPPPPR